VLLQDHVQHVDTIGGAFVTQPEKKDSRMGLQLTKDQVTEVLVIRNENAIFAGGTSEDVRIPGARHLLVNGDDVVAGFSEEFDHCLASGFVHQKAHGVCHLGRDGEGENVLVGDDPCGVMESSPDVFRLQTGILSQDFVLGHSVG
jgi:hypothetical protein